MEIFKEIMPLRRALRQKKHQGLSIGLVPTMGALHEGHASLIRASIAENDLSVCSIFVNPQQFNNPEDLEKYPRKIEEDVHFLEDLGCDLLFCPTEQEMYQGGEALRFNFGQLEKVMEGEFRPGHFSGVGLVVSKLFNIVHPDKAYFGQKDLQQYTIIDNMVRALNFDLELVCMPIIREANGLAQSSRNERLTPHQREEASVFFRSLNKAKTMLLEGEGIQEVKRHVSSMLNKVPEIELEYFEIVNKKDFSPLIKVEDRECTALCIAGFLGGVRLIDNVLLS